MAAAAACVRRLGSRAGAIVTALGGQAPCVAAAPHLGRLLPRRFAAAAGAAAPPPTDVFIVDPRLAFSPGAIARYEARREAGEEELPPAALRLSLPAPVRAALASARFQLAEADEPGSYIYVGPQTGEIFQYTFLGTVSTSSGRVGVLDAAALAAQQAGRGGASVGGEASTSAAAAAPTSVLADFEANASQLDRAGGPLPPFLYVGRVVEAACASIFSLGPPSAIRGLLITSDTSFDEKVGCFSVETVWTEERIERKPPGGPMRGGGGGG